MLVKLKTETETLNQINDILSNSPDGAENIKKAFIETVAQLHKETFDENSSIFLLVDDSEFDISVKKEHKDFMKAVTGHNGPYRVTKTMKSWVGLSEGVYAVEGCDKFIPVSWCKKPSKIKRTTLLTMFLALSSLIQSGALLLLLL